MSLSYEIGARGTVLWTGRGTPHILSGEVVDRDEGGLAFRVDPAAAADLAAGDRVVLSLDGPPQVRVTARVGGTLDGVLRLTTSSYQHLSRRDYPRIDAPVALAYRLLDAGEGPAAERLTRALVDWARPLSPEVNLSVAGLAFLSPWAIPEGARLGLRVLVGEEPHASQHEVEAEVVRCTRVHIEDPEEQAGDDVADEDTVNRVAVRFLSLTEDTREAFIAATLKGQDDALGLSEAEEA